MKLKLDENGNVVLKDGMPVYVHDDGKEIPFDAPAAMAKISSLNTESKNHRLKAEGLEAKFKLFEGIEDPAAAMQALATVKNLKDKQLIDAGEVETLKKQMGEVFEKDKAKLTETITGKDTTIRKLLVSSQFAKSPLINEKTILPPDIAETYFGANYKVEEHNGEPRVVGYLNGAPIYSRVKAGELADFEEAMSVIIDTYPMKDRILKGGNPGSGAGGDSRQQQAAGGMKRSAMSEEQKSEYIDKNGFDAFKSLPA